MNTVPRLAPVPPTAGRTLDAQLHLMDRQVLDHGGVPVTTVDDLELSGPDLDADLPPSSRLIRIPWKDVADVGVVIRLGVSGENLDAGWVERWIRDKVIARIPGGRHDPR